MDLNTEWNQFVHDTTHSINSYTPTNNTRYESDDVVDVGEENNITFSDKMPKCSDLYISTKTMIGYLKSPVDLNNIFWTIPVISYSERSEGVIKKQIKFNSTTEIEVNNIIEQCKNYNYVNQYIMQHIDNPTGRIKFKDVRKISIGVSKKDVISYRIKQKSAFYNCFVVIIRIEIATDMYKEFHVKVFNTGKLELPGIRSDRELQLVYTKITSLIGLTVSDVPAETVLINSNFRSGYYIKRNILYQLLKKNYNISAMYDPCSYPGIQCKLYITPDNKVNNHAITSKYISFMIFRTGSVLIVGKCTEEILYNAYDFVVDILKTNYETIIDTNINIPVKPPVVKKKKRRTIICRKSN